MYIRKKSAKLILNQSIININLSQGGNTFIFSNNSTLAIYNKYKLIGVAPSALIGQSITKIEEKKAKYIRFFVGSDQYIEVDLSYEGFEGPEILQISNRNLHYWDIVLEG